MKKYAFFDIDKTIYDGYLTSGFLTFLANKKLAPQSVHGEYKKMSEQHRTGEISYAEKVRQIVNLAAQILKNKKVTDVDTWKKEFITKENRFFPWTRNLFTILKKNGYHTCLVSAAISPLAKLVADILNAEKVFSSKLTVESGLYTGGFETILNCDEKRKLIGEIVNHPEKSNKIGFGDSSGDIEMLSCVDSAFLYKPREKELIKTAQESGWHIVNEHTILEKVKSILLTEQ